MKRQGAIRFSKNEYYEINVDDENITLKTIIDGVTTNYDVTGSGELPSDNNIIQENENELA